MDKILVIDDSIVQCEYLRSILCDEFEIVVCQTGRDGLQTARNGKFSLVLLDIIMPDMDGFMILQELKATEITKYIPVILITSLSDIQHEEKGLLSGAVDYITKPFSPVIVHAERRPRGLFRPLWRGGVHCAVYRGRCPAYVRVYDPGAAGGGGPAYSP